MWPERAADGNRGITITKVSVENGGEHGFGKVTTISFMP
jgi:hypothetical protein